MNSDGKLSINFSHHFLNAEPGQRFLFGLNIYSAAIAEQIPVEAFVESSPLQASWRGLPVIPLDRVPHDAVVVVCSGGRPQSALALVKSYCPSAVDYFTFYRSSDLSLPDVRFNERFGDAYDKWQHLHVKFVDRLADAESRDVVERLTEFRRSLDLTCLDGMADREQDQYFEPFLNLRQQGEVFFDIGAFDGETSKTFTSLVPEYAATVMFEPDPTNAEACRERFRGEPRALVQELALSDTNGFVSFAAQSSSTSAVSATGHHQARSIRLDDLVGELPPPSLVKMDVEGHEANILEGGAKALSHPRVRLAIGIYHSPEQFLTLPARVLTMRPTSTFMVRHYTESIYETVLYCI